ncbi:MAG: hypothetical protein H8M99_07270 [Gloeobacteraceae cyanobacterium ES-bin-144]|nr:hypothetical protein [Verrucomicrobiales bacterium]
MLSFAERSPAAASPRYVFAHYMVCFATYGETVDGYKREIREAQAAGIDGFALNVGAWDDVQSYYKRRVSLMYDAAEQLGTGFKLFFSVDFMDPTNIVNMVESFGNRSCTFRHQGKIVLSSYGKNDVPSMGWTGLDWPNVIELLRGNGYPIFFIPYFFSDPVRELPGYSNGESILSKYGDLLDGLFYFGAAGLPPQLAGSNSEYNRAVQLAGKTFMASVAPAYWGMKQPSLGRRYYEFDGGEGLALQWSAIITNQPDWVEICTWNDFNESTYVSPVDDPGLYFSELQTPHRHTHKGYLELSKRFISWYKTGQNPSVLRDELFYFYRTHPRGAVATSTNDVPVSNQTANTEDSLYLTMFLKAPTQLEVISGTTRTTNSLPAGMTHVRTPFSAGPQTMTLRRGGVELLSARGPDIVAVIQNYNFFLTTGFAYGRPPAPQNARPVGQ